MKEVKPWVAGLGSLILPGSGHLYVGRPLRFFAIFGAAILVYCGLGGAGKLSEFPFYVAALFVLFAATLILAVDAYRIARTTPMVERKWYRRWWAYLCILLFLAALVDGLRVSRESLLGYGVFRVPGGLMEPTILQGETILVDTHAFRRALPKVGDVIVYENPEQKSLFIQRVATVNADTLQVAWDYKDVPAALNSKLISISNVKGRVTSVFWSPQAARVGKDVK